ncbi:hypothetical protein G7046_g9103 [Stylonectria norvegica]|nr:hypothetical protein G7046_g9103 [Stylonectria norvegica]
MAASRGRTVRFWHNDEEMAKKDDDLHSSGGKRHAGQWQASRTPRRSVVARLALYALFTLLLLIALLKFAQWIPSSSDDASYGRDSSTYKPPRHDTPRLERIPGGTSDGDQAAVPESARTYYGPIKFLELAKSLHAISGTGGSLYKNRNVLFAAASLQSAATLLPMACLMASERDNYVHFALVSRNEIDMEELLNINGIDTETCNIILHGMKDPAIAIVHQLIALDARPDYPDISTETRMTLVAARALYHMNSYMHPQAVIVDDTEAEEEYFLRGFRDQVTATRAALIELPERPGTRLRWLTKLDASALSAWNKVHFDILIHAPAIGSGNLRRLLTSLSRADLSGITVPHLTVELPSVVEESLETLVGGFRWPTWGSPQLGQSSLFSLRHRIPHQKMSEEESSVRFLESFWPTKPTHSHVLVLSPHTEVTPQFFQYVKYSLLHHRYSSLALLEEWDQRMMGISFQSPSTHLDTKTPFHAPDADKAGNAGTPFLWQAPSSDAVLFMGDKWVELHGYVSQVLEKQHSRTDSPAILAQKQVSTKYPSWLEHVLRLSRIRGYFTIYPSAETAGAITGIHSDLYDKPEEYTGEGPSDEGPENGDEDEASESFDSGSQVDVLATLPQDGTLIPMAGLPLLSWDGKTIALEDLDKAALEYATEFRREVGECSGAQLKTVPADKHARDLFCNIKGTDTKIDTETDTKTDTKIDNKNIAEDAA